jgi:hypothetical protein
MKFTVMSTAAVAMIFFSVNAASAASNRNQVYSSSMKQCIPKALMCDNNQVYSSSMSQCIPKQAMCDPGKKYRNGRCV